MKVSAVILSGGRSSRFGGTHKPGVELGGQTVISRILDTVRRSAVDIDVRIAGPLEGLSEAARAEVVPVREEPAFSGPLAGIDAAVRSIVADSIVAGSDGSDVTLLLAGDMPLVGSRHLGDLIRSCAAADAPAVGFDDRGSMQFLCAAWPTRLLVDRLDEIGPTNNRAVKLLYRDVETVRVDVDPRQLADFDTPEEFDRVRARLEEQRASTGPTRRPVPDRVLRMREQVAGQLPELREISDADAEAVLDFASRVKHSGTELSPVLAAFLAGRLYAQEPDARSVAAALARVEATITDTD